MQRVLAILMICVFFGFGSARGAEIVSDSGGHQYEEIAALSCPVEESALPLFGLSLAPESPAHPEIAIVIDDVGLDRKRSARAVALPENVTLAFLPYSPHIAEQAAEAKERGHELLVHLPMQPGRKTADPGPDYLSTDLSSEEIQARVVKNLSAFDGYDGVNNHMGSKFTRDRAALAPVMQELKARGLFFLDSKTAEDSVAEDVAREAGLATTHRDIFIDHYEDAAKVEAALEHIERLARRKGTAVAIGHPKDVTLDALEKWLPTLAEKGFDLVPVSRIIGKRAGEGKKSVVTLEKSP